MELINLKVPAERVDFATAVRRGLGQERGLFFFPRPPAAFSAEEIAELLALPLVTRSRRLLRHLIGPDEIPGLETLVERAFTFPAPLAEAGDGTRCLELFHGPTLAFKDFGARFMAQVLSSLTSPGQRLTILTATSGDTGAAVAAAFHGLPGIEVVILYPKGRVAALQERMIATLGGNVRALRVRGTFDECQDLVKTAFEDRDLREQAGLNSANSINISRLLAQVCYYFEAVAQLPPEAREKVAVAVPCGNFGNLTAGLIARALGLKARFVIGCNANDTVPRYLKSGTWEPHPTVATLSNAMDISRPNNWPRIEALFHLMGWSLADLSFASYTDAQTEQALRTLYAQGYVSEPHAAIAWRALREHLGAGETGIFLGTASPAKFKADVDRILGINLSLPEVLEEMAARKLQLEELEPDYEALKKLLYKAPGDRGA